MLKKGVFTTSVTFTGVLGLLGVSCITSIAVSHSDNDGAFESLSPQHAPSTTSTETESSEPTSSLQKAVGLAQTAVSPLTDSPIMTQETRAQEATGRDQGSTRTIHESILEQASNSARVQSSTARTQTPMLTMQASRRMQGTIPEPSNITSKPSQNTAEEVHTRLTAEDLVSCMLGKKSLPARQESKPRPKAGNSPSQTVTRTTFQNEVYAFRGYVTAKIDFSKDQVRNLSEHLRKSKRSCDGHPINIQYRFCCAIRVRVPKGFYAAVKILERNGTKMNIYYGSEQLNFFDERHETQVCIPNLSHRSSVLISSSNVVNVVQILPADFDSWNSPYSHRFVLRFEAIEDTGLQVRRVGFNRGAVETPLHQDKIRTVMPQLKFWSRVSVPVGHVIMFSVTDIDPVGHCVKLFVGNKENIVWRMCHDLLTESDRPDSLVQAAMYNTTSLYIYLNRHFAFAYGFQLVFSFHNYTALPKKLSYNLWNCSVPYLSDFLFHLSCDKTVECHDSADEKDNCSYTTDLCGPGYLTLGGACFFFIKKIEREISWHYASDVCSFHGGQLAVIDSFAKMVDINNTVPCIIYDYTKVFVGARKVLLTGKPSSGTCRSGISDFVSLDLKSCGMKYPVHTLCEKFTHMESTERIQINGTSMWSPNPAYIQCLLEHFTHQFLQCDVKSSCRPPDESSLCRSSSPYFTCTNQLERVPYTLVCDHHADCVDDSDEDFCTFPPCRPEQFACDAKQCVQSTKKCDGWSDCHNGVDESVCLNVFGYHVKDTFEPDPPALVEVLPETGRFTVIPMTTLDPDRRGSCPYSHFQCPGNGYCLPIFLRCNSMFDCPGHEDEVDCDACPGFYRCRASKVCLYYGNLCDGHAHCPQYDDELMCQLSCPPYCVCRGMAFFCRHDFTPSNYPFLRFLDASSSGITPARLVGNVLLIYLKLGNCNISDISELSFHNLLSFNVDDNQLNILHHVHFAGLSKLRELSVAGNPLTFVFESSQELQTFQHVRKLDLSRVLSPVLNVAMLSAFYNLQVLNLSYSGLRLVPQEGFGVLKYLRVIDIRGCPVTWFPRTMFNGLSDLQTVYGHNYKVCCPDVLPMGYNLHNCFAPSDEISSCSDLLLGYVYSVSVFVLSLLSVAGNAISFIFRTFISKGEQKLGFSNFVSHLSVADFLMGVYLAIIGSADQVYRDTYIWNDVVWRQSVGCKFAGFLSLLSSEVSALIICLITLDRFLVLCFPLTQLHFNPRTAHIAALVVWVVGVLLASVPLLPMTSHWEFYSQTAICIPLPITRTHFAGRDYSFAILIVFNFFVFIFISMGQLSIYWSVRTNSMSISNTTKKNKDVSIARRLITVAVTDFMCWFPIGVLGLLSSRGVPIPGEVNVAVAIFVLPLNSAINPCLYTLNVILERRRREQEEKLRKLLFAQLKTCS